jgi:hypothetical protein
VVEQSKEVKHVTDARLGEVQGLSAQTAVQVADYEGVHVVSVYIHDTAYTIPRATLLVCRVRTCETAGRRFIRSRKQCRNSQPRLDHSRNVRSARAASGRLTFDEVDTAAGLQVTERPDVGD